MVVQSIASSYAQPKVQGKSDAERSIVSKDDFLKLLVTQLQKQDPLNPSDPTQFTSQLAQFSSLEQLIGVNDNLSGLSGQQSLASRVAAAGFIGKTVRVSGSNIPVSGGKPGAIRYELSAESSATSMNIYNAAGDLVNVLTLGKQTAGAHDFTWDGLGANGAALPDGNYRFDIVAQDSQGQRLPVTANMTGQVSGVRFGTNGQTLLEVGGLTYSLEDLISVGA